MGASCARSRSNASGNGAVRAQRVRPAGFAEAAHDGGVVRFQKDQAGVHRVADLGQHLPGSGQGPRLRGCPPPAPRPELGVVAGQLGELGDQVHRQVVHRVVPQVFKRLEHGTLARPAEAGDDDQLGFGRRSRRALCGPARGHFPGVGRGCGTMARHGAGQASIRSRLPSRRRTSTLTRSVSASR